MPGTRNAEGQRGVILIWVGMFLLLILSFMSLGIDLSKLMATRTQLQNAADAAALAAASSIDPETGVLLPDTAVVRAQNAAYQNKAFIDRPEPIVLDASDVQFIDSDKVKVTVRREGANSMVTTVAQVIGITALEMKASATAKVEPASTALCGIVPLGVSPATGETFHTGCSPGYVLKTSSGSQGNYGALKLPACGDGECAGMPSSGASTFRCLVQHGYCCPIDVGDKLETQPGNISSFRKAVLGRFKDDTDQRENICYSEYTGNGSRVVTLPVTTPIAGGGTEHVTVLQFAAFFLKNVPDSGTNSTLEGEFVYYVAAAYGGGSPMPGVNAFAVRLID